MGERYRNDKELELILYHGKDIPTVTYLLQPSSGLSLLAKGGTNDHVCELAETSRREAEGGGRRLILVV
jgi:hypothetical protein